MDFFLIELGVLLALWTLIAPAFSRIQSWIATFLLGVGILPLHVGLVWPLAEELTSLKRIRFGPYSEDLGPRFFHSENTMPGDGFSNWVLDLQGGLFVALIWFPICIILLCVALPVDRKRSEHDVGLKGLQP